MAKVSIDLMGEEWRESRVECFTLPSQGVCLSLKTDKTEIEIDLPEALFKRLMLDLAPKTGH